MSAVAENSINIPLHNTTVLHIKPRDMDYLIRKAIGTEFHPNNTFVQVSHGNLLTPP
jgi:hypothetical protein